jgi:hypothetical protein
MAKKAAKKPTAKKPAAKSGRISEAAQTVAKAVAKSKTEKPLGALDAAAKILARADGPKTTKELIDAMAAKGLWKSPDGKTPERTLYSAITREIAQKGRAAWFKMAAAGMIALQGGRGERSDYVSKRRFNGRFRCGFGTCLAGATAS